MNADDRVSRVTHLEADQVDPFVVRLRSKDRFGKQKESLYVNQHGRRWKMDERFGAGRWHVKTIIPEQDEIDRIRSMWGTQPNAPLIIVKAQILIDGQVKYEDYGWATPASVFGGRSSFRKMDSASP